MLLHKTNWNQRNMYTYSFYDGKSVQHCTLQVGKNGITQELIKLLHSLDDSEVYYNLKNRRPELEPWEQKSITIWKFQFSESFIQQNGYAPTDEIVDSVLQDVSPKNWIASLEEIMAGNDTTSGLSDKSLLLSDTSAFKDDTELADIERLHDIISAMKPKWQQIYHDYVIMGLTKTEIAQQRNVSETCIRKTIKKILAVISSDETLKSLVN